MKWDSKLATGIPMVDCQHKMMFKRLDILLDRRSHDRVAETLEFLADYAVKHFGCEEMMMKCCKFPFTERHIALHQDFVAKFTELKAEYEKDEDDMLTLMKLTDFVGSWLLEHIMSEDKQFTDYFKGSQECDPLECLCSKK